MQSDEVLLNDWDAEILNKRINEAEKEYAKEEGIELGEAKERKNLIENMFKNGATIDFVSKVTSVSKKQLQKIKTNISEVKK